MLGALALAALGDRLVDWLTASRPGFVDGLLARRELLAALLRTAVFAGAGGWLLSADARQRLGWPLA